MMEAPDTASPFMLYVVWHPEYVGGGRVADLLLDHFGSHRFRYVSGGAPVRVMSRNAVVPGSREPLPIEWGSSDTTAVVVLLDNTLAGDDTWMQYVQNIAEQAEQQGLGTRVFPVAMEGGGLYTGLTEQALHWHDWAGNDDEQEQHLVRELTYAFTRMLRHQFSQLRDPGNNRNALGGYLEKIRVFLSHSKHDRYGECVAQEMRAWLNNNAALAAFLDVLDIPAGISFESVIDHTIGDGVMVSIYTDSYSSREWCRREVVRAKRLHVPMLMVDCLQTVDERSFPYLGNVPSVRMNPAAMDRLEYVAGYLMDEVFKYFLWQCRVESLRHAHPQTTFLARAPELISLASRPELCKDTEWDIVYPGPPLGSEEVQLFADVAQDVRVYSLIQWAAEKVT